MRIYFLYYVCIFHVNATHIITDVLQNAYNETNIMSQETGHLGSPQYLEANSWII
jgi:hypothetical protein